MTDKQIISGIEEGDENAICSAIDKYSKLMWHITGIVLKNVASAEDIEECVADVFIYLWQNHAKFNEKRSSLKSYLSIIAKSKAIDKFRKLSKSNSVALDDEMIVKNMDIVDNIITDETKRELLAAIASLSEIEREIILRRYYYEQKISEISFALDCSKKQIENRLYRAKQKLIERLICEN